MVKCLRERVVATMENVGATLLDIFSDRDVS